MGYETTVDMIGAQKHCKYQASVRMHQRHDVPNLDDKLLSNNNTMGSSRRGGGSRNHYYSSE